jgi:hypothetical protein
MVVEWVACRVTILRMYEPLNRMPPKRDVAEWDVAGFSSREHAGTYSERSAGVIEVTATDERGAPLASTNFSPPF